MPNVWDSGPFAIHPHHPRTQTYSARELVVGDGRSLGEHCADGCDSLFCRHPLPPLLCLVGQESRPMRSAPWPVRQRRSQTPIHRAHRALSAETPAPEDRALELAHIKPCSDLEAHVAHLSKGQCVRRRRRHQRISLTVTTSASCSQAMALTWRWRRASSSSSSIRAPSSTWSPTWTMTARGGASCSATQRPVSRTSTTPCVRSASASTISSQDLISTSASAW